MHMTYCSHKEYLDIYKSSLDGWIINKLLPKYKQIGDTSDKNRRFMFIGPGPAPSVNLIIDYFDEFVFIEPNPLFIENWKSQCWWEKCNSLNKKITIIPSGVENIWLKSHENAWKLQFNSIDAIIANHCAYYFPLKYLSNIFSFLLSLLKRETGLLHIGIVDDTLDLSAQITKQLNPYYSCSISIESALNSLKNVNYLKLVQYTEHESHDKQWVIDTLSFYSKEEAFNKNWVSDGQRMNQKQKDMLKKIMSELNIKQNQQNGKYILPLTTNHYLIQNYKQIGLKSLL
eukprot:393294_1